VRANEHRPEGPMLDEANSRCGEACSENAAQRWYEKAGLRGKR
jgi:hypothetical protein